MYVLKVTCILALGSIVLAADPKPCCLDREYEADLNLIGTNFGRKHFNYFEGISSMANDAHNKLVSVKTHALANGTMSYSNLVLDYNKKREYLVANNKCTVFELNTPMLKACIPDNATFVRETVYGYGSNSLIANVFKFNDESLGGLTFSSVTKDECIPLVTSQYNKHAFAAGGKKQDIVMVYSNFHVGIKNRNVFNVPAICHNQPVLKSPGSIFSG